MGSEFPPSRMKVVSLLVILGLGVTLVSARSNSNLDEFDGEPMAEAVKGAKMPVGPAAMPDKVDPAVMKMIDSVKAEESTDEIDLPEDGEPEAVKLPTLEKAIEAVVEGEKKEKEGSKGKSEGERFSGSFSTVKTKKIWSKRWSWSSSSSGSSSVSSSVSWGSGMMSKKCSCGNFGGSGSFSIGTIFKPVGGIKIIKNWWGTKPDLTLHINRQMIAIVVAGGKKFTFSVSLRGQTGGTQYIVFCKLVGGLCKKPRQVDVSEVDKYLAFGLVIWNSGGVPMFGLVAKDKVLGPENQGKIYAYGSAKQMAYVINRLFIHYLIKTNVIKKGLTIDSYQLIWENMPITNDIPSGLYGPNDTPQDKDIIWDIPYWMPPKNRAHVWTLVSGMGKPPQVVYNGGKHVDGYNPAPIEIPALSGVTIIVKKYEVPASFWQEFNLVELKFPNLPSLVEVVCDMKGGCKSNKPDDVDKWEINICELAVATQATVCEKPGKPGDGGGNSKPGDSGGSSEPGGPSGGYNSNEGPGGPSGSGGSKSGGGGPDETCYCKRECGCDEDGQLTNNRKKRKRELGTSQYVSFVRRSSCRNDVECKEAFSHHLRNLE